MVPTWDPEGRMRKLKKKSSGHEKKVVLHTLGGSLFGAIFDQKSMPKMEHKKNESRIAFWADFGGFGGHCLTHF